MKIIFMGTPQLVTPILEYLNKEHEVCLVVTQKDKPRGRGKKESPSPIKEKALELNLNLSQPDSLKSDSFSKLIASHCADLIVVVAFFNTTKLFVFFDKVRCG